MNDRPAREQVRIALPETLRQLVDGVRARWSAERVASNPAHITIVYPDELVDPESLRDRVKAAASGVAPFSLHTGSARVFGSPAGGIFLSIDDPHGGVERLRRAILRSPANPRVNYSCHVTLHHPRRGDNGADAWTKLSMFRVDASFTVDRVAIVRTESGVAAPAGEFALRGR
jgi:2'-5' RNA ligase